MDTDAQLDVLERLCRVMGLTVRIEPQDDGRYTVGVEWGEHVPTDFFDPPRRSVTYIGDVRDPVRALISCINDYATELIRNGRSYREWYQVYKDRHLAAGDNHDGSI